MAKSRAAGLTLAESGALALLEAAARLDQADDAETFVSALETNRRVWEAVRRLAEDGDWLVPSRRQSDYAIGAVGLGRDDQVAALIDINREVAAELAGGTDLDRIRERAYFIWESRGRPHGRDLEHWLVAEMELAGTPR
ncbi:MAG: DUF2934 domain-containing protein [Actinomycetota bacterium]